jgi:hypothetical protein
MSTSQAKALVFVFLSVIPSFRPSVAVAQIGHDPAHSPYVDLRRTTGPMFLTGWLGGERGRLKVGHANGRTYTVAFDVPISRPMSFVSSVTYALTERFVINPFRDDSVRLSGPFDDDMLLIDAGLRFNITGGKTWRGFSAYVSGALGVAISSGSPPDSGSYKFGKKVTVTPGAGLRFYPSRRFSMLVDARVIAWRLQYPPDYFRVVSSDGIPVLTTNDPEVDWTIHPLISFGLGWNF